VFLKEAIQIYPSLEGVCADAGYRKTMEEFIKKNFQEDDQDLYTYHTRVVCSSEKMGRRAYICLAQPLFKDSLKDYEISTKSSEAFIMIAHSMILLKRAL